MNQSSLPICGCFLLILFLFLLSCYSKKPSTVAQLSTCSSISCEGSPEQVSWASSICTKAPMCSSYLCGPHNSSILCRHARILLQFFSSTAEELVRLLVRSVRTVLKGCPCSRCGGSSTGKKHSVGFNSCHQLQVKCGCEEQTRVYFQIWRNWAKIWRIIQVTQVQVSVSQNQLCDDYVSVQVCHYRYPGHPFLRCICCFYLILFIWNLETPDDFIAVDVLCRRILAISLQQIQLKQNDNWGRRKGEKGKEGIISYHKMFLAFSSSPKQINRVDPLCMQACAGKLLKH